MTDEMVVEVLGVMKKGMVEVLDVLEGMLNQYCGVDTKTADGRAMYDHMCMSAGEEAAAILLRYRRITNDQLAR